jgi:hypothetical protein
VVDQHRGSGLTQREFCQRLGLPVSTLQWWLTKARRAAGPAPPVAFAEVTLSPGVRESGPAASPWAWEMVVTRDGVTVRSREAVALADLVPLLRTTRC